MGEQHPMEHCPAMCVARLGMFNRSLDPGQASQPASTSNAGSASMQRPRSAVGAHGDAATTGPRDAQPGPQAARQSGQGGGQGGAAPSAADPPVECVVVASAGHLTVLQVRAGRPGGAPELAALDTLPLDFCCTSLAAVPDAPAEVLCTPGAERRPRVKPRQISERAGWTLTAQAGAQVLLLGSTRLGGDGEVHLVRLAVDAVRVAQPGLPGGDAAGVTGALPSISAAPAGATRLQPGRERNGSGGSLYPVATCAGALR